MIHLIIALFIAFVAWKSKQYGWCLLAAGLGSFFGIVPLWTMLLVVFIFAIG